MNIFLSKSKYSIGMTKEPYEPVDLKALYEKARQKKIEEKLKAAMGDVLPTSCGIDTSLISTNPRHYSKKGKENRK